MEYRTLGTSELKLLAITYGAFAIGGNMWGWQRTKGFYRIGKSFN